MCIQKFPSNKSLQTSSMNLSKEKSSINDPDQISLNTNRTYPDVDSSGRSYALIETDPKELDRIIDLLRQFFPKTKIIEYNKQSYSSQTIISPESDDQLSTNTNSQAFKGKVKGYLQRRYLEQVGEYPTRHDNLNSFDLLSSSTINKPSRTLKTHSLDSSSIQTDNPSLIHSPSKRGLLQRYTPIDIDDSSNNTGRLTFNINQYNDIDEEEEEEESSSYSKQQRNKKPNLSLLPYHHSSEQGKLISVFPGGIPLPLTPYSSASDPGPYHSPWLNTPTSTFNFRFPQGEEQLVANAQGSIAQLSTLTKMLCDEPSVFTPITPRFKIEKSDSNPLTDSSSIPPCQICRQEFDSHQMYLTHYRQHLENTSEDDMLDSEINNDRAGDSRNYLCTICSKRFSRSDMLNRHLRLHSGIRPYRCTMCNTQFSRSDHLSTHLRTHTGEKPYTCPQCSYTACRRDMITRHLKIHRRQRSERKNATSNFASTNDS